PSSAAPHAEHEASGPADTWQVDGCRAKEGQCGFALTALSGLKARLEGGIRRSPWQEFLAKGSSGPVLPHRRLRIALAACPNACSQPQIRDIGLIACLDPGGVRANCTGCGQCVEACREDAIAMDNDRARLHPGRCLGCGLCVRTCPEEAIEAQEVRYRVLLGGRLGRHPRWATELPLKVAPDRLGEMMEGLLSEILRSAESGERFSDAVERLGAERLAGMASPRREA
ncbi:hypothetical protein LCGC14_2083510, partial [marine sediment metagenome]